MVHKVKSQLFLKIFSVFLFVLLLGSYMNIFALGEPYAPGTMLDPSCAPTDPNCIVSLNFISDGNTGWDNSYGFITSYTETDPVFSTATSINGLPLSQDNTDFNVKVGQDTGLNLVAGAQYNTFLGYEAGKSASSGGTNDADNNTAIGYRSLFSNTTGNRNTANGYQSLYSNTTGIINTANGYQSLYSNTTGTQNTANGTFSLYFNTTGIQNTANGYYSLYRNTTGNSNTANGSYSLYYNTTGTQNTANGYYSLYRNTTGNSNTANGSYSLYYNTTGSRNSANGYGVLYNSGKTITAGSFITGVSYTIISTGTTNFTVCGATNSAVGTVFTQNSTPCTGTGTASSNSNNNVAEGYNSGVFIANGSELTATSNSLFLGASTKALADNSTNEIVIGYNATGNGSNTATIGDASLLRTYLTGVNLKAGTGTAGEAPLKFTSGTLLTAPNTEAGAIEYDGTHLYFTATNGGTRYQLDQQGGGLTVGTSTITSGTSGRVLYNNSGTLGEMTTSGSGTQLALTTSPVFVTPTLGVATATSVNNLPLSYNTTDFNIKIGTNAGLNLVSGAQYNTFLGYESGKSASTGGTNIADYNTAIGYQSLYSNTIGSNNTANGFKSLFSNTTGWANTANGYYSLYSNTEGPFNTANGYGSLFFNTTGSYNVANGYQSLTYNTTGSSNIAIGYDSGVYIPGGSGNTSGDYSIFIGAGTKASADNNQNEIVIGYNATGNGSNSVTLGSTAITKTILQGSVGIGIAIPTNILHITGTPVTGTHTARIANTLGGTSQNNGLLVQAGNDTGVATSEMITFTRPDNTVIGSITQTAASAVGYNSGSDRRIKENIMPTIYGLEDLLKIEVSDFNFISDSNKQKTTGFIAQDLNEIFPVAVTPNGDDGIDVLGEGKTPWMIDYGRLTPLIVKSIQEMDLKVKDLSSLDTESATSLGSLIKNFLEDETNGIRSVFFGEVHTKQLCIDGEDGEESLCITKEELQKILENANASPVAPATPIDPVVPLTPVAPVDPLAPVEPVDPIAPVAPPVDSVPVEPLASLEPVVPVAPVDPIAPLAPTVTSVIITETD